MFGDLDSAFWFYGRLHPSHAVPPFQAEEIEVDEGVRLEVVWDGIGVWSRPGVRAFKQMGEATELFRLVVAAYALLTRKVFDVSTDGWIEATAAQLTGSILGFRVEQSKSVGDVDRDSKESAAIRAACLVAIATRAMPSYRLALRDIYSALREVGNDAFFFAYRAVEDAARVVSGGERVGPREWGEFHQRIGLTPEQGEARLAPLTEARKALAHGDENASAIGVADRQRRALLDTARWFVIRAMESDLDLDASELAVYLPECLD
jgi:hypothetical protein